MKKHSITASIFTALFLNACGQSGGNASTLHSGGTVNDLPNRFLKCVESVNGHEVLDGRAELTLSKDQFKVISALITQRDQFSGDKVIGRFLSVAKATQNPRLTVYTANEKGVQMNLTVDETNAAKINANLVLVAGGETARTIEFVCKRP